MKASKEQLNQIEEMAKLQFDPAEVAVIVGVDPEAFKAAVGDTKSPAGQAFHRGRLISEAQLRMAIFKQAGQGSTPAQRQAMDLVRKAKRATQGKRRK